MRHGIFLYQSREIVIRDDACIKLYLFALFLELFDAGDIGLCE